MTWVSQHPEDWQLGGKCDAFLWGGGRHGQMCEGGRSSLIPMHVPSFSTAQQVRRLETIPCFPEFATHYPRLSSPMVSTFSTVTEDQVTKIIMNSPTKSCSLGPLFLFLIIWTSSSPHYFNNQCLS